MKVIALSVGSPSPYVAIMKIVISCASALAHRSSCSHNNNLGHDVGSWVSGSTGPHEARETAHRFEVVKVHHVDAEAEWLAL
jgi:hypothetical protein